MQKMQPKQTKPNQTIWQGGSSTAGALGNVEYLFIATTPRSGMVAPERS